MKRDIKDRVSSRVWLALSALAFVSACSDSSDSATDGGDTSVGSARTEITVPEARGLLPSLALDDKAFEGEYHSGSAACSSCHTDPSMTVQSDAPGELRNVSIGTAWETSVMAQSTRDPYWHAVVASEMDNFPTLDELINDECLVCHAPAAHDLASKTNTLSELRLFDKVNEDTGEVVVQGIYTMDDTSEMFNHAMDGVTCSLCHQIEAANLGTEESMTGGYEIVGSTTGDIADRPAYGQYADPEVGYMRTQSNFTPILGSHLSTSESCATCHNLNIEPVDPVSGDKTDSPHFAEQAVYTEWLLSDYNVGGPKEASCQACHMPVLDEDAFLAQGADNKRPDFAEHTFLGANTVMQDMFMNFAEELGIDPSLNFDEAIERNREFLTTAATITLSEGVAESGQLNFDVTVQNNTGHKLPSGYHSRRVYLHVQVLDAENELVFESGRIQTDGRIVGNLEDVNPELFEPHYDVITDETQVQVYQSIVGDINDDRTHSLLSGSGYLKDNRLTPSGFDKDAVAADTTLPDSFGTFGAALEDDNFNDGRDVVSYQVTTPSDSGIYTVVAELRYQPLNYGHLQTLWTQADRIDPIDIFRTIYDQTTLRDEVIDTDIMIAQ